MEEVNIQSKTYLKSNYDWFCLELNDIERNWSNCQPYKPYKEPTPDKELKPDNEPKTCSNELVDMSLYGYVYQVLSNCNLKNEIEIISKIQRTSTGRTGSE